MPSAVARKIPTDEPQVLFYLRIAYIAVQALSLAFYFYLTLVIKKKNDLTVLKYVQPPAPMVRLLECLQLSSADAHHRARKKVSS